MLDSDQIDLYLMCRICLSSAGDMMFLHDAYSNTELSVADVYKTVTNIEFTDSMPKHICHDCFCELNQSYKYILKCRNSNKKIKTNLDQITGKITRDSSEKSLKDPLAISEQELNLDQIKGETDLEIETPNHIATTTIYPISESIQTTKTLKSTSNDFDQNTTKFKAALNTIQIAKKSKLNAEGTIGNATKTMNVHNEDNRERNSSTFRDVITTKSTNQHSDLKKMPEENLKRHTNKVERNTNTSPASKVLDGKSASIKKKPVAEKRNSDTQQSILQKKTHTCTIYSGSFKTEETIKHTHMFINNNNNSGSYSCVICDVSFNKEADLYRHQLKHASQKPYACSMCTNAYKNKSALTKHERTHSGEKPYKCTICTKAFTQKVHLSQHMSSHTSVQPYACSHCDSKFKRKTSLIRHTLKHTGGSVYSCTVCRKAFSKKRFLMVHSLKHNGGKLYACKLCGMSFRQQLHLTYHERTHTGERPNPCTVCDKSFNQKANLNRHLLTHTEVKQYTCAICEWSFKEKSNLAKHVRMHSGDNLYICEICAIPFNKKVNLTRHLRTHNI